MIAGLNNHGKRRRNEQASPDQFTIMGRVASVTDSLNHSSATTYDKAGRKKVETDANGNATRYDYDEAGRLTTVTEASGAVTSYTYDKSGNKLTQKDANNHLWNYKYDALNRLTEEKDPLGRKTSYTYDVLGNLQTKTDGKNQVMTYGYNIRRLTSITYPGGADSFTYDPLGRRITASNGSASLTYTYDALNRIKSVTNSTYNLAVQYDYDAMGNVVKLTPLQNGSNNFLGVQTYAYDAKNRLATLKDTMLGTFTFGYDAMDRRTSLSYPNGVSTSYAYDNAYRITSIATKNSKHDVVDAWSYGYDAVGNRTTKTDMDGKVESYSYDNVYRLTEARYGDGAREAFTYDPVGNRMTRSDESGTTIQYSYDIANQMLTAGSDSFVYDGNGSITSKITQRGTTTLVYDGMNRITSIAGPDGNETSVWGADGTRVRMNSQQWSYGDSKIIYDLRGNAILETGFGIYRVFGPGIDELLVEHKATNHTYYYHHDALGSVTAVTNETGALSSRRTYRAFGQMTQTVVDNAGAEHFSRYAFTDRELSVGTMMQYRSRTFDATYGRFAQQDTHKGEDDVPLGLHRYTYVRNCTTNFTDPTGHNAYPLTFPSDFYEAWNVEYMSATVTVAPIVGLAGFAVGLLVWDARSENGLNHIQGVTLWVGVAVGKFSSVTKSSMKGYSPRHYLGDTAYHSDFDGDSIYLEAGFAWGVGFGFTLVGIGTVQRSPNRSANDGRYTSTFISEPTLSGTEQYGFDVGGAAFGVGYSFGW